MNRAYAKQIGLLALVSVALTVGTCVWCGATREGDTRKVAEPAPAEEPAGDRGAAEAALRDEPKVEDVLWSGSILYVGVLDDGDRRDGFASYICDVLREHEAASGVTVIVKDVAKLKRGEHVELGKARCDR